MKLDGVRIETQAQYYRVVLNRFIVVKCAKRLLGRANGLDLGDAIGVGNLALIKAAVDFDPKRGCKFSTLAYKYVMKYLNECFDSMVNVVKIPQSAHYLRWMRDHGHDFSPTTSKTLDKSAKKCVQLKLQDEDNRDLDLMEPAIPESEAGCYDNDDVGRLRDALSKLPERDQAIVLARFGLDGEPMSLVQIGNVHGLTKERVRQILNVALAELGASLWSTSSPKQRAERSSRPRNGQRHLIEDGKCVRCHNERERHGALCASCTEWYRKTKKADYVYCQAHRVCYNCHGRLDRMGATCMACLERRRAKKMARGLRRQAV